MYPSWWGRSSIHGTRLNSETLQSSWDTILGWHGAGHLQHHAAHKMRTDTRTHTHTHTHTVMPPASQLGGQGFLFSVPRSTLVTSYLTFNIKGTSLLAQSTTRSSPSQFHTYIASLFKLISITQHLYIDTGESYRKKRENTLIMTDPVLKINLKLYCVDTIGGHWMCDLQY